jgi:hypothetical protein
MRPAGLEARQHHRRLFFAVVEQDGGRMTDNDFVKEMQEALLTQQEHDDPASRASPDFKVSQTARKSVACPAVEPGPKQVQEANLPAAPRKQETSGQVPYLFSLISKS